jgi:hypothetical protein
MARVIKWKDPETFAAYMRQVIHRLNRDIADREAAKSVSKRQSVNASAPRKLDADAPWYWLIEYLRRRDEGRAGAKMKADEALGKIEEYKGVTAEHVARMRRRERWPEE